MVSGRARARIAPFLLSLTVPFLVSLACGAAAIDAAFAAKRAPRLGKLSALELDVFLAGVQKEPALARRLDLVSQRLLGTPYRLDPLGEGPRAHIDRDPIFSLARVDCLTFVEQTLALAQRFSKDEAVKLLQRYRYEGGEIRYDRRRHLMELQWLPGLAKEGLLKDVTRAIGGEMTRVLKRKVTPRSYLGKLGRFKRFMGKRLPVGEIHLSYVPKKALARGLAKRTLHIGPGTIMALVRRTARWAPIVIKHVGFVMKKGEALVFRHAIHVPGRAIDEPLARYLRVQNRDPKSLGFHFAEPLPARAAIYEQPALQQPAPQ